MPRVLDPKAPKLRRRGPVVGTTGRRSWRRTRPRRLAWDTWAERGCQRRPAGGQAPGARDTRPRHGGLRATSGRGRSDAGRSVCGPGVPQPRGGEAPGSDTAAALPVRPRPSPKEAVAVRSGTGTSGPEAAGRIPGPRTRGDGARRADRSPSPQRSTAPARPHRARLRPPVPRGAQGAGPPRAAPPSPRTVVDGGPGKRAVIDPRGRCVPIPVREDWSPPAEPG